MDNFYHRHGVTVKSAKELCRSLGLNPSTNLVFAANLLVTLKMKY